jgi:hypothetical protein
MSESTAVKKTTTRKRSAESIAKQKATAKAKRLAKEAAEKEGAKHAAGVDVEGAIAALRAAKRAIRARFVADARMDFGEVELNVLSALKMLQGSR